MLNKCLIVILILLQVDLRAQVSRTVAYRHFNTRNGLPSTQVQGIFEDSKGYIWTITDRGAARYNGYEFTTYTSRQGLPTNNVLLINEDHSGRIWFMCNNGEYCYLNGDTILRYNGNEKIKKLLRDKLPGPFFFDEKDTLWITTFSGIQLFRCFGDSVNEFIPQVDQTGESPTYYLRKVGEKLLTLQVGQATANNKITTTDNISYLLEVAGECKLACSVQVGENRWAVAGPGGFVVFDEVGNVKGYFDPDPYLFSTLEHDRTGQLWLTNSNGAYRIRDYNLGPQDSEVFFEGHFITAILQDRAGNYWFGDRDNGLFFVPSLDVSVYHSAEATKQNKIVSLKKHDNRILYADASGEIYSIDSGSVSIVTKTKVPSGVTLDFVPTKKGNFIVGNKAFLYNTSNGKTVQLNAESTIRKSIVLEDGRCAFALADGLAFLGVDEKWVPVEKEKFSERSNTLYEDSSDQIWIGTNSGLFLWENENIAAIDEVNKTKPRIVDITKWNDYLLLATRSSGLIFYKPGNVIQYTEADGLLSDMVDCIAVSDDGMIWVGTGAGLQRLKVDDLISQKISSFKITDQKGLPSNEVNDLLFFGQNLYVATNDGLAVIRPNASSLFGFPSDVRIDGFSVNNVAMPNDSVVILQYNENNIQIAFQSLNFRTGNRTTYRYRLKNLHDDWVITNNRSADFWQLSAGEYLFEVSAMNEDGEWGPSRKLSFIINKHFSETWWFRITVILFSLGIIALCFTIYFNNKRRKLVVKSKMLELRQQALNANMNPHFIFNSLNSIQHFINSNQPQEANEYLADFSKLVRMNLETNLQSEVSLEDELERLNIYLKLEKLRFGDRLRYDIRIDHNLNCFELMIPPMLLQPYVENALIHGILPSGKDGWLHIDIKPAGDRSYMVEISDDGIGINKSMAKKVAGHDSLALRMNRERLQILSEQTGENYNTQITDLSEISEALRGTRVIVRLPV